VALNVIDFSDGIRPEEIQENFEKLEDQISRERLGVGGTGIAYGLDIIFNQSETDFSVTVTEGSIIDDSGDEIFIEEQKIDIELPILSSCKEYVTLDANKQAVIKFVPYALSRRCPVERLLSYEPDISGIQVKYRNSLSIDDFIRVRNVRDKVLTISGSTTKEVEITYYYTAKRIDTLYIDKNFNIKVKQGTTSTTPSAILPTDARYLLAYIEIDHEYRDEADSVPHAYMDIKTDLRTIRNLYTDRNGTLYVCGTPFEDLQIIHMQEPKTPVENTIWLNPTDNTMYYWHATDGYVYRNKIEIDGIYPRDFAGDITFATEADFGIGTGELSVYLNGVKLVKDRDYEELSHALASPDGNAAANTTEGNIIRFMSDLQRPDQNPDIILQMGDVITYTIEYKDGQFMWVPLNKQTYVNSKNTKVYCTWYDGIPGKYQYKTDQGADCAYFDSVLANSLDEGREIEEGSHTFYPNKYQYFLFEREKDLNMLFTPNRGELTIMVNQIPLHEDQYKEIRIHDLRSDSDLPKEIRDAAANHFGWTSDYINKNYLDEDSFDNSGIGFYLLEPLDSGRDAENSIYTDYDGTNNLFIEATVQRRICVGPINRKLERTATFVDEDIINPDVVVDGVFTLQNAKYGFGECQLEVFKNGLKLINGIDYIEEFGYYKPKQVVESGQLPYDYALPIEEEVEGDYLRYYFKKKASVCTKFKINNFESTANYNYKITTNIYSYDHINSYMDRLVNRTDNFEDSISALRTDLYEKINDINRVLNLPTEDTEDQPEHNVPNTILSLSEMPPTVINNLIKSLKHINYSLERRDPGINSQPLDEDIYPNDYVTAFIRYNITIGDQEIELDKNLIRDEDYSIVFQDNKSYIKFLKANAITGRVFISGIKLDDGPGRTLQD